MSDHSTNIADDPCLICRSHQRVGTGANRGYCIEHQDAVDHAERRIVEWLRAGAIYGESDYRQDCTRRLADAIERGAHRA